MTIIKVTKWLRFEDVTPNDPKRKTKVIHVINKEFNQLIGVIKWYPAWRKYSFFTPRISSPTKTIEFIFESTCLKDIATMLEELMDERNIAREREKNSAAALVQSGRISEAITLLIGGEEE